MKRIAVVSIVLIFASFVSAQKSKIVGNWLVTKVEVGNDIENPFMPVDFTDANTMIMMGMEMATWTYDKKRKVLLMKSDLDKDFNGESKIISLTDKELVVEKNNGTIYYEKLNLKEIEAANSKSGMLGLWEFVGGTDASVKNHIDFKAPDTFKIMQRASGFETTITGSWIFDESNSTLLLIGVRGEDLLAGKSDILEFNKESVHLKNNGVLYQLNKKATNTQAIERLSFTQDDFFTEDGNYKYDEDEEKLPWKNLDESEMKSSLSSIDQLVYKKSKLIRGSNAFEHTTLTANVVANMDEEIHIDNIFIGYDRFSIPDDYGFPPNTEYTNSLYPLEENMFRIVGNEQITTAAGTFDCTVMDVLADNDINKKVWMINDKFGVYAKIIQDDHDESFGDYYIYELQELKSNKL